MRVNRKRGKICAFFMRIEKWVYIQGRLMKGDRKYVRL